MNTAGQLQLLDLLGDGSWHSGEQLARGLGVTRAAVSKRVARLRDWGLVLEARPRQGYRLAQALERLEAARIRAALPGTACRIEVLPVTDSTNQRLLEADAAADPQALFAEYQSAGRGRRGRHWVSPFGMNLYLSLAWSFPQWPPALGTLPLAMGVACAEALEPLGLSGLRLKWPNDLWVGERKLGGILIEQRGEAGGACRVVIGLGLNVHMPDSAPVDQPWIGLAAALTATGRSVPGRNTLAAAVLAQLLHGLGRFQQSGFASFRAAWTRLDLTRDRRLRIHGVEAEFEGLGRGVDASGALQVEVGGRLRSVVAGDVSLRLA